MTQLSSQVKGGAEGGEGVLVLSEHPLSPVPFLDLGQIQKLFLLRSEEVGKKSRDKVICLLIII